MTLDVREQTTPNLDVRGPQWRSQWTTKRLLKGALPAAGITFGLFIAMNAMIGIDGEPAEEASDFVFKSITPEIEVSEVRDDPRPNDPIDTPAPPPDLPPVTIQKVKNFIPIGETIGKAPERIEVAAGIRVDLTTVNIPRKAMPIGPLNVSYPTIMLQRDIQGFCEVRFDLSPQGEAYNIRPECSHPGFDRSAKRAVSAARFSPSVEGGQQVGQTNMVYPIEYRISEEE